MQNIRQENKQRGDEDVFDNLLREGRPSRAKSIVPVSSSYKSKFSKELVDEEAKIVTVFGQFSPYELLKC